MKKFNVAIFLFSTILVIVLMMLSLIAAGAADEGTIGTNMFWIILSKLFLILRFPTHTLFFEIFSDGQSIFLIGLFINCLFYGFVIERIVYLVSRFRKRKNIKSDIIT